MCRTGAEAQPSSAANKRLLWFRGVWRNPRLPPQQLRIAAGLCLDRRTILRYNFKRTLQRQRKGWAPTGGTTKAAVCSSRGPGWDPSHPLAKPEENPTEENREKSFTYSSKIHKNVGVPGALREQLLGKIHIRTDERSRFVQSAYISTWEADVSTFDHTTMGSWTLWCLSGL